MDHEKIGKLLSSLRKEKKMTQKQLADQMNISDKTISKWERGLGAPDVSLLTKLSELLGVNVEKILLGELELKEKDGGNMKKIKFYVCPNCKNIVTSTSEVEVSCCGRKLERLIPKKTMQGHELKIEEIEDEYYITFEHEMSKSHYISFIAYVKDDRILLVKMYPEQGSELRFPRMKNGKFYFYCIQDGLWVNA